MRAVAAALLALLLAGPAPGAQARAAPRANAQTRVIVLGFDGLDARTAAGLMDRGELPNFARLREQGTFAPLGTTVPAESPVSWAALNCGRNPAKTGVPGFVKRELTRAGDPQPALGHQTRESRTLSGPGLPPHLRFLAARDPLEAALLLGAACLAFFLLLFLALLRLRPAVAGPLALLLAALGGVATHAASRAVPRRIEDVVANPVRTDGFWEAAARAGVASVVLDAPMAWDREHVPGTRVLAGLGVPDVRGATGDWFVYTADPAEPEREPLGRSTPTGGTVFRVDEIGGRVEAWLHGPRDLVALDLERVAGREPSPELLDRRLAAPLVVTREDDGRLRVSIDGREQVLAQGAWSDWYRVRFDASVLLKVGAITRVKVLRAAAPLALYVDFLQIDPEGPPPWQPVSQPASFSGELARDIGSPYETVGWACMTMPFKDREIDAATFLEDMDSTRAARERMLQAVLPRDDWRLLFFVESTPDRVQHMTYQYADPAHPLFDAAQAASRARYGGREIPLSDAIAESYRQADRLVGEVLDGHVRPGDTLIVCSDHGFQSFRRGVNLNNWLLEKGYLELLPGTTRAQANLLRFVDWSRTRAYAVGLGMIFANQRGRERQGIVPAGEVGALLDELERDLLATEDGGKKVVREVVRMARIHAGPHLDLEADLMPGFEAGYRVGWSTTTGGIRLVQGEDGEWAPAPAIEDNASPWSGDHVSVARDLVAGVFFCNRVVEVPDGGVDLLHVAPTVLALLGVAVPAEYDRAALRVLR